MAIFPATSISNIFIVYLQSTRIARKLLKIGGPSIPGASFIAAVDEDELR
jgi:hypothetical protein